MAAPNFAHTQRVILGTGYVSVAKDNDDGTVGNFKYWPQSQISLNVASEIIDIMDDDSVTEEILRSCLKGVTRTGTLTLKDLTWDALEAFLGGTYQTDVVTATPVADEAIVVNELGTYIYPGISSSRPGGYRKIGSVTIDDGVGAGTAYTADTDYVVDGNNGRIWIPATSSITPGDTVYVDYTPVAETREQLLVSSTSTWSGFLKFQGESSCGSSVNKLDIDIPAVVLTPNGDFALKSREEALTVTLDIKVNTRSGYPQMLVNGSAIA